MQITKKKWAVDGQNHLRKNREGAHLDGADGHRDGK